MMISITQLGLGTIAGALTTLSPCVLPILPFVLGGAMQENRLAPLAISSGLVISFVALGWPLAAFGNLVGMDQSTIRVLAGGGLAITGLVLLIPKLQEGMTRILTPLAARAETRLQNSAPCDAPSSSLKQLKVHFTTGLFLGAIWSPCSGPTLGSAIALASQEGGGLASGLILMCFGLGAVLPLLGVAYGAKSLVQKSKSKIFSGVMVSKKIFGVLMLLIGISIVAGLDKKLESFLVERMPEGWTNLVSYF